ncbi:MAG: response regulator transcription factor [Chloroflexota bacterium]|nr:response regulator transcription factor [Chloroflexota bacterium]
MTSARNVTILLVDDDALFVGSVAETLQAADYTVETAASGREAFAAMRTCHPGLIMLDIPLPDIAGTDFCHIVRQRLGSVPIILLTLQGVTQNAISALDAGADDCINKSCDARELLARVRAVLRRAPAIRPAFQG